MTELEKRLDLTKTMSEVKYSSLMPGVTVRYELSGNCVKEDIIIANQSAAANIKFRLPTDALNYSLQDDQSIIVTKKQTGEAVFFFEAPHAFDSSEDQEIQPVQITLTPGSGDVLMTYTLDSAFLSSAVYPITIDPIVRSNQDIDKTQDMTLTEGASVSTTGQSTSWTWLKVGKDSNGTDHAGLIRFTKLPKLKSSDTIVKASLVVFGKRYSQEKYMYAHEVLRSWKEPEPRIISGLFCKRSCI